MFACKFFDVTQSHTIACMCYSKSIGVYFVASTDFKLHAFNDYLSYLGWWPLKTRSVNHLEFMDE